MVYLKAILSFLIIPISILTHAQDVGNLDYQDPKKHTVNIHWEVPVQIGLQYEYTFSKKLSAYLQVGILRKPNSTIVLNTIDALGTDEQIVDLIESAFQSGLVFKQGINYNFKKNYIGFFFQQILLTGNDTPSDLVGVLLNEDLNTLPRKRGRSGPIDRTLTLHSNLIQLGLHFGRKFPLKSDFYLLTEAAISFNITSSSSIESSQLELSSLNAELDNLLNDTYSSYAHIPSIKFGIAKKF